MTKKEFIQQYVLSRPKFKYPLHVLIEEAEEAWNLIEETEKQV